MAKPIKGSAVFWMLTAENGRTNKKTVHAGTEIIELQAIRKLPPITGKSVTSALSFGRLLRFHHVGIGKGHVIGFSQFQQEL